MESRRLSGRGARALRRVPYPAQCARRGTRKRAVCRRRCRQLARLRDQRAISRAGAVGCRRAVRLSPQRLAPRSRCRARADGAGGQQPVVCAGRRCPGDCHLYGRRVRCADAGSQAPGRGSAGAGQIAGRAAARTDAAGAAIYAAACATCHESNRPLPYGGVNLALSTAISGPDARNVANIVLSGVRPVEGERSPIMPGFAGSMNDAQIASLLNYLRSRFSDQPAWTGVEKTVADARRTQTVFLQTSAGPNSAPADPAQRDKP